MKFVNALPLAAFAASLLSCSRALPSRESRLISRQEGNGGEEQGGAGGAGSPDTSLTLDPSVIAKAFALDGVGLANGIMGPFTGPPSLTSTNNFINFCVGETITNGKQVEAGSCNPTPIGTIPSIENMPSSRFIFPKNMDTTSIQPNTEFVIKMNVRFMKTGVIANTGTNFLSAPQQLQGGQIVGHAKVVIEKLTSVGQTEPPQPGEFAFFKIVNEPAVDDIVSIKVNGGVEAGSFRMCSILSAANSQPCIVAVAQRGALDDCVYFTVGEGGNGGAANQGAGDEGNAGGANKKGGNQGGDQGGQGKNGQGDN